MDAVVPNVDNPGQDIREYASFLDNLREEIEAICEFRIILSPKDVRHPLTGVASRLVLGSAGIYREDDFHSLESMFVSKLLLDDW